MAAPVNVSCTANTWVKVATNVTSANIWRFDISGTIMLQTYVLTGAAAPSDETTAVEVDRPGFSFQNSVGADIYIKSKVKTGAVRVDA